MAKGDSVWLDISDVYTAIGRFTDDQDLREFLRRCLRDSGWTRGWNWAFADYMRNYNAEFAAYLKAIA